MANYWAVDPVRTKALGRKIYKPNEQLLVHGIEAIVTLPITARNQDYLVAALEIYLIGETQPALNKTHRSNGNSYRK
ncbi:MAG: hypothetical protein ICV83_22950 [Cytophagales bacterium]|nr:hypothetical protein [Cytophagales bacterium]